MVHAAVICILRIGLRIEEGEAANLIWQPCVRVRARTGNALIVAGTRAVGSDRWVGRQDRLSQRPAVRLQVGKRRTRWDESIRRGSSSSQFDSIIGEREKSLVTADRPVDFATKLVANVLGPFWQG